MRPREINPISGGSITHWQTDEEVQQQLREEEEAEARGDFSHFAGFPPARILQGLRDGTIRDYRVTHVETVAALIARMKREEEEQGE